MPGIFVPVGGGQWTDSAVLRLQDDLQRGRPELGFRGDPRLYVALAVAHDARGRPVDRRVAIRRKMEDGRDVLIGRWKEDEVAAIIPDLVLMDLRNRNRPSVIDRIEAADARREREIQRQTADLDGEMADFLDHAPPGRRRIHSFAETDARKKKAAAKRWDRRWS